MTLRVVTLLNVLAAAAAWGPDGHTIVAHIAQALLTPEVNTTLHELLGDTNLTYASDWNDDYTHMPEGEWSEGLHFTNYPGRACSFDWELDCKDDFCNAGAIVNYTLQLADTRLSNAARLFALKFVIHMMGDIHQPLHVASGDDRGGNYIHLAGTEFSAHADHWQNRSGNLHQQWDGDLPVQDIYDIEYTRRLLGAPTPQHYHKWQLLSDKLLKFLADGGDWHSKVAEWQQPVSNPTVESSLRAGMALVANGTAKLGCEYAYSWANGTAIQTGDILPRSYYLRSKPIVEEQLAKGGVRLAQILNIVLAKGIRSEPVIV